MNANVKIKKGFLQGLCDSELSKITKHKNKNAYQNLKYYCVKEENFVSNGIKFLKQIKTIFKDLKVKTSNIEKERSYVRSRDNGKMTQLYFFVYSNYINLFNFIKNVGFRTNSKRKEGADSIIRELKFLAKKEKKKIKIYKRAIKLRKEGHSAYHIAKELDAPVGQIKNWIYGKHKPRLLANKNYFL